jgi:hypothetical protein
VGNYPQLLQTASTSLRSFLGAFGVVGGIYMFASALKSAFETIKENDKANADLAATMGVTRKEIAALTKDQQRLGASTKFTATEVAGLQKEYAKLGFSQREILSATEATLNLAAAVDTDLANAAMVGGSTLRAFGLDASQMSRVTDVMASSFTKSALDIENFRESMKYVAPIARATNVSIEKTTALLGILADNGIKGSMAGTSLRRILTDLAATGKPFNEAFGELQNKGITVADAFDEVGRNAQSAFLILANNVDKVNALGEALDNAGGSAERMANEQLKSLEGEITLLSSAWDGFILGLNKGEGMIGKFFKEAVFQIRGFVDYLNELNQTQEDVLNSIYEKSYQATVRNLNKKKELSKEAYLFELSFAQERVSLSIAEIESLKERNKQIEIEISNMSLIDRIANIGKRKKELHENRISIEKLNKQLQEQRGYYEGLLTKITPVNEAVKENTEATKENNKVFKESKKLIEGTVAWYNDLIAQKKRERDETKTSTEAYKEASKEIEILEERLKNLKNGLEAISIVAKGGLEFKTSLPSLQAIVKEVEKYKIQLEDLQPLVSATFDLGDTLFERQISRYDALIAKSNEYYDALISNAEDGSAQELALQEDKAKAEEQLLRRKAELERKQAIARKAFAISEIAINTAVAIMKNNAQLGFIAAQPLNAITIALGAIQAATVLAQPIPQYKDGTSYHKGGDAIVGDGGKHEVMITPDGKQMITPNVSTLIKNMPKGTKVMPDASAFYQSFLLNFKQKNDDTNNIEKAIERGFKKAKINNYMKMPKINISHEIYKTKGL